MEKDQLPATFVSHAADVLAETNFGLTGTQIVRYCNEFAVRYGVNTPITSPNFGKFGSIVPNKRTALYRNLCAFCGEQQFEIIKELSELPRFANNSAVLELKRLLFERYTSFSTMSSFLQNAELTGWIRVDRAIEEMRKRYEVADTEEKYQAIGMLGRETLISIAQQVFKKEKHSSVDGTDIGTSDVKRMLEAYLTYTLKDESEKVVKFVKAAMDMSNQLTHDRTASKRAAAICIVAVSSIAAIIREIEAT